jgi:hypothetical protein
VRMSLIAGNFEISESFADVRCRFGHKTRLFNIGKSVKRSSECRLDESRCIVDHWRMDYNYCRWHSNLAYMASTVFAVMCLK